MDAKPKARILVVDDDSRITQIIRFTLEHAGFCVTVAADGGEALSAARCEAFDLVLTDDQMPEMNGRDLCLRLRDDPRYAKTPFIFVTGKRFEIESEIIKSLGRETMVISKPFSLRALLSTVEATLGVSTFA